MSEKFQKTVIGTRGSDLALVQAASVERTLSLAFPDQRLFRKVIRTTGDRRTDVALADVAKAEGTDKGIFTKELEEALRAGEIDIAVHSLKDVPTVIDGAFEIAGVLRRAPVRDVLVSLQPGGLDTMPAGSVVGTSSVRRTHQLEWLRPELKATDLRGNVPTRLAKLAGGACDAILLAEAGLVRLGYRMSEPAKVLGVPLHFSPLEEDYFFPAAGQGAIGLEIRRGDKAAADLVAAIADEETFVRVRAEREFLRLLEGGCSTPVGIFSSLTRGHLIMDARVFPDGGGQPRCSVARGTDPLVVARQLFDSLA